MSKRSKQIYLLFTLWKNIDNCLVRLLKDFYLLIIHELAYFTEFALSIGSPIDLIIKRILQGQL